MNFFVIIRGPAGIGKTAIAKELAGRLSAHYMSVDLVLAENGLDLIKNGIIKEENFLKSNEIIIPEVIRNLDAGKSVVLDGNFYHRFQIEDLIAKVHYECFVFTLKATLKNCIKRDNKRKEPLGEDNIRNMYELAARFSFGTFIETNGKTESEIVDEIMSLLPGE